MACIYWGLALSTCQGTPGNREAHPCRVSHSPLSGASQVSLQRGQEVAFVLGANPAHSGFLVLCPLLSTQEGGCAPAHTLPGG